MEPSPAQQGSAVRQLPEAPAAALTTTGRLEWLLVASLTGGLWVLLLAAPKLILTTTVQETLSGDVEGLSRLLVLAQDLLLAWASLGALMWAVPRASWRGLTLLWAGLGLLLFLLLVDMRVRQLWLKPLDIAVVRYFFEQFSTLGSSSGLFLTESSGFGMTFRRLLVVACGLHMIFGAGLWVLQRRHGERMRALNSRSGLRSYLIAGATLAAVAIACPNFMYSLQDTLLVTQLRAHFRQAPRQAPPAFEQPLISAHETLTTPRLRLADAAPFKNLVLVLLESFRVRGIEVESSPRTPNLRRFAQDGLLARAYTTVPHSSKGAYAVLSGRMPSSGVVIREAMSFHESSVFHDLREQRGASTYAFSAAYLGFENTDGLLRAHGFERIWGAAQLEALTGAHGRTTYGTTDEALVAAPSLLPRPGGEPFACVILTSDSHHPYVFPGKKDLEKADWQSYANAIEHTDRVMGDLVAAFDRDGLADDTLFVFVGDHGESFGEHGAFVHNNSLYEEEITVPLLFWSKDARLRQAGTLEARQIDVAPTIADLMGLKRPKFETQGVSLLRSAERPPAFVASFFEGVSQALVLNGIKYMFWPSSGRLHRFDLRADASEQHPVEVAGEERERVLRRLASAHAYEASIWAARD